MSYCRFSDNDYQCDVYVYADCNGGYTTHVAGNRVIFKDELPGNVSIEDTKAWLARYNIVSEMLDNATREDIGLEYDCAEFNHTTAEECADNLEMLKQAGYNVPQYAIDALREDQ